MVENKCNIEHQEALHQALSEIRTVLPPQRYGWRKALENGLENPRYIEKSDGKYKFWGEMNIGKSPEIISYDCLTGSVVTQDILARFGITSQIVSTSLKETGYMFINDTLLMLADRSLVRIVPMFPILSRPGIGEKYILGELEKIQHEMIQNGKDTFDIDKNGKYLPLSGFHKAGLYLTTGVACNFADDDSIHFIHHTLYGKGTRRINSVYTIVSVPKNTRLADMPTDLDVLLQNGVQIPVCFETQNIVWGKRLITFREREIYSPFDPNAQIKATRLESFRRDSKALAGLAKSISMAFYNSK